MLKYHYLVASHLLMFSSFNDAECEGWDSHVGALGAALEAIEERDLRAEDCTITIVPAPLVSQVSGLLMTR